MNERKVFIAARLLWSQTVVFSFIFLRPSTFFMTLNQEIKQTLSNWKFLIRKYNKPDTKKALLQLLNTFLPFLGLWALMYFSLSLSYWLTLALAIVNAFFLVRIFIIQHDCGHQSFLKSTRWNNTIGFVCSIFSSIPYTYWAKVHDFHHAHAGQLETREIGDIDFLTVEEYRELPRWRQIGYRIFRAPLLLFFIVPIIYLLYVTRFPLQFRGKKHVFLRQLLNNLVILAIYVGLAFLFGWKAFMLIQLPILTGFICIAFWFFYVQHQHEFAYKHWKDNWDYLLSAIKGSTYYKLPRVFQWLSGSIGYHHIHHLNCGIPNYNLAQCAEENPVFQKYVTTITFRQSLRCIQHKLWHEQEERMITFGEYRRLQLSPVPLKS